MTFTRLGWLVRWAMLLPFLAITTISIAQTQVPTLSDQTDYTNKTLRPCEDEIYTIDLNLSNAPVPGDLINFTLTLPPELLLTNVVLSQGTGQLSFLGNVVTLQNMSGQNFEIELTITGACDLYNYGNQNQNPALSFDVDGAYDDQSQIIASNTLTTVATPVNFAVFTLQTGIAADNHNYQMVLVNTPYLRTFRYENTGPINFNGVLRLHDKVQAATNVIDLSVISNVNAIDNGVGATPSVCIIAEDDTNPDDVWIEVLVTDLEPGEVVVFQTEAIIDDCIGSGRIGETITDVFVNYGCNNACNPPIGNTQDPLLCFNSANFGTPTTTDAIVNPVVPIMEIRRINNTYNCPQDGELLGTTNINDLRHFTIANVANDPLATAERLYVRIRNMGSSLSYLDPSKIDDQNLATSNVRFLLNGSTWCPFTHISGVNTNAFHGFPNGHFFEVEHPGGPTVPFSHTDVIELFYEADIFCPDPSLYPTMYASGSVMMNDLSAGAIWMRQCSPPNNANPSTLIPSNQLNFTLYDEAAHPQNAFHTQPGNEFLSSLTWTDNTGPLAGQTNGLGERRTYCIDGTYLLQPSRVNSQLVMDPNEILIKVQIDVDPGLDLDPTTVSLGTANAASTIQSIAPLPNNPLPPPYNITMPATNISAVPGGESWNFYFAIPISPPFYGLNTASGGFDMEPQYDAHWERKVDFRTFFDQMQICFDLIANCPEKDANFDPPNVTALFHNFYKLGDPACSANPCEIPLAMADNDIIVTCPGCFTPGWNLQNFALERTTFDAADINEDHFPDGTGPASPNDARSDNIINGDVFNIHLEGVFTDGHVPDFQNPIPGECNLTLNSGFWNAATLTQGQLHLFGTLMDAGFVDFLGGSGSYTNGNGTVALSGITGGTVLNGDFILSVGIADLEAWSGTTIGNFAIGDQISLDLCFQLKSNNVSPGNFISSEQVDGRYYVCNSTFGNVPADDLNSGLLDGLAFDIPGMCATAPAARDDIFLWCTGSGAGINVITFDDIHGATTINAAVNSTFPVLSSCLKRTRMTATAASGQDAIQSNNFTVDETNQTAMNIFSQEVRDFMELDLLEAWIPPGLTVDNINILVQTLVTDPVTGNTSLPCYPTGGTAVGISSGWTIIPVNGAGYVANPVGGGGDYMYFDYTAIKNTAAGYDCASPGIFIEIHDETKVYGMNIVYKFIDCAAVQASIGNPTDMSDYPVRNTYSNHPGEPLVAGSGTQDCGCAGTGNCLVRDEKVVTIQPSNNIEAPNHTFNITAPNISTTDPNSDLVVDLSVIINGLSGSGNFYKPGVNNFFLAFDTHCGNLMINNLFWTGANPAIPNLPIVGSNGPYNLYGIDAMGIPGFHSGNPNYDLMRMEADYTCTNCTVPDTITVYYGWDCFGYPTLNASAPIIDGNSACFVDSVKIVIQPSNASLQTLAFSPQTPWSLCNTETVCIDVTNGGSDPIENVMVTATLPNDLTSTGTATFNIGIESYNLSGTNNGNQWVFDLSGLIDNAGDPIVWSGVQGATGGTGTLCMDVIVGCTVSGQPIDFAVTAESYCGESLSNNQSFIPPAINPFTFTDDLSVTASATDINTCNPLGITTLTVDVAYNSGNITPGNHSITIQLPPGYVFSATQQTMVTDPLPAIPNNPGIHTLTYQVESNAIAGCGTVNIDVDLNRSEPCALANCTIMETTSVTVPVNIEFPELNLSNLVFDCNLVTVDVDNFSNIDAINWEVDFYCGVNGIPDLVCSGGQPLATFPVTSPLLAGGNTSLNGTFNLCPTCPELIAVVHSTDGCECDDHTISVIPGNQGRWHQTTSLAEINDIGNDIVTDAQGNVYVTGNFGQTTTFDDGVNPPVTLNCLSNTCMFVAKYDECGRLLWVNSTADGEAYGNGIEIDENPPANTTTGISEPVVYVVGALSDAFFLACPGDPVTPNIPIQGNRSFVAVYNASTGCLEHANSVTNPPVWTIVNNKMPEITAVDLSAAGALYIGGRRRKSNSANATWVPAVAKLSVDPLNTPVISIDWFTHKLSKGHVTSTVADIAIQNVPNGNDILWVTGTYVGKLAWTATPSNQNSTAFNPDAFIASFVDQGNSASVFANQGRNSTASPPPGSFEGHGEGIAVDASGTVYFTGTYQREEADPFALNSNGFGVPAMPGAPTLGAESKSYMGGFNISTNTGFLHTGTTLPGTAGNIGDVFGKSVAFDQNGVYYGGEFTEESMLFTDLTSLGHTGSAASRKLYFVGYSLDGSNLLWKNVTQGNADQSLESMAVNQNNEFYSTGSYQEDLDYFNGAPASGPLDATDELGNLNTTRYNAYIMRGQSANGELRISESAEIPAPFVQSGKMEVELFPNPNKGVFTIHIKSLVPTVPMAQMEVYDVAGKWVASRQVRVDANQEVNLALLEDGLYLIRIIHSNQIATMRFVKQ